jgi:hypothetical protein
MHASIPCCARWSNRDRRSVAFCSSGYMEPFFQKVKAFRSFKKMWIDILELDNVVLYHCEKSNTKDWIFWAVQNSQILKKWIVQILKPPKFIRICHFSVTLNIMYFILRFCTLVESSLPTSIFFFRIFWNFFFWGGIFWNFKILNSNVVKKRESCSSGYIWTFPYTEYNITQYRLLLELISYFHVPVKEGHDRKRIQC